MNFDFKVELWFFFQLVSLFFCIRPLTFWSCQIQYIHTNNIHLSIFFSALHNQLYCRRTWFQSRGRTFTSASSTYSLIFIFSNVNILIILLHTTYILFICFHLLMLKNKKSHFKENKMVSAYLYKQDWIHFLEDWKRAIEINFFWMV